MSLSREGLRRLDRMLAALKATPRTGWMLRGVHAAIAESIAEHMSEATVLALVLADYMSQHGVKVDPFYAAAISAVHDLSESVVGDIVKLTVDAIGKERKEKLELKVASELLGNDSVVYKLMMEYVEQKSLEAHVAKLAETLSTLLQSLRYMSQGFTDVAEIACSSAKSIEKLIHEYGEMAVLEPLIRDVVKSGKEACSIAETM
ncbi:hypothetical protein CF15_03980 [Pyrodictium occultum]|uniref:HD domain-containing protein n=1 Tax=Pyrodictium occultum TaxID=2309 RepID=A0A0V8RV70_PYROC|nr:HD domain-containing protein [Pyrodictium occultum]KSW11959.1 hypothetical protein CF15_03980 [Pyrodictium occultum]